MTVFKGYLLMIKKNLGMILLYFGIFAVLAMISANDSASGVEEGFTGQKMKMLVVDDDKSDLSEIVTKYLKEHHQVTFSDYNKKALYEQLYYQKTDLVLYIPKGMGENVGKNKNLIELTWSPGSYGGIYVEQQINQLLGSILEYQSVGYSLTEAYEKISSAPEAEVLVMKGNEEAGEGSQFSDFFGYVPYLFIAGLGTGIATVIFSFRKKQLKMRMMASSVSLMRQNAESVLAVFITGFVMYLATLLMALVRYKTELLQTPYLPYYLLNLFLDLLLALALAFVIGMLVKKMSAITMCVTSLSLALAFLGGVFVKLEFLSPKMLIIAKFIPVYWYEVVNELLKNSSGVRGSVKTQIWQAYGMQLLFVVAIFAAGLVIAKRQQQEN